MGRLLAMDAVFDERQALLKAVEAKLSAVDRLRVASLVQRAHVDGRISDHRKDRPGFLEMLLTLAKLRKSGVNNLMH